MIKKIIFIILVITVSYYAGSVGIKPKDFLNYFKNENVSETILKTVNSAVDFADEKEMDKKAAEVFKDIKKKINN